MPPSVVVFHRNDEERRHIRSALRGHYNVFEAQSVTQANQLLLRHLPCVLFLELSRPRQKALELIGKVKQSFPGTEVVAVRADSSPAPTIAALWAGAFGCLSKHDEKDAVLRLTHRARERADRRELSPAGLADDLARIHGVGMTSALLPQLEAIRQGRHVLIAGEVGTGRMQLACALHRLSTDSGAMRCVDCTASAPMLCSFLRGMVASGPSKKGSRPSREGDLCLLHVEHLAERELDGLKELYRSSIRGRSNRESGTWARYRLIAIGTRAFLDDSSGPPVFEQMLTPPFDAALIEVPPLRRLLEDIPHLWAHFAQRFSQRHGIRPKRLSPSALDVLVTHSWPGNLVELANLIEKLTLTCSSDVIDASQIPIDIHMQTWSRGLTYRSAIECMERRFLLGILERSAGCRRRAAERLQLSYSTLKFRLKKLGIATAAGRRRSIETPRPVAEPQS